MSWFFGVYGCTCVIISNEMACEIFFEEEEEDAKKSPYEDLHSIKTIYRCCLGTHCGVYAWNSSILSSQVFGFTRPSW